MNSRLYELLKNCGMKGKNLAQRRRLIAFAWENCERKTPYVLDQLLTHGGVFTQIRILVVVAMFGYDEACRLYPVLDDGEIEPPSRNMPMIGDEEDIEEIYNTFEDLGEVIDSPAIDKSVLINTPEMEEEE